MEERSIKNIFEQARRHMHGEYARKAVTATVSFFMGFFCARGLTFGKYSPFGVAVVAASPRNGMWAAALGTFFGYLIPSAAYVPARYIAAVIAVVAIRWSISELRRVSEHPFTAPVITLLPLLLTGIAIAMITEAASYTAVMYIAESILGAGSAYFFKRISDIFTEKRYLSVLENADTAAMAVCAGIVVLSFSGVEVAGISVGRIFMILMVIYLAREGGIGGGAVAGVAAGAIQGLSTAGLSYLSGAYGLGGLMAGVFSPMGKAATAIAFIVAHGVASLQAGDTELVLGGVIETAVATVAFMLLPRSRKLEELFSVKRDGLDGQALRTSIVMKLKNAASALVGVSGTVEEVSEKLNKVCAPNLQEVYNRSVEKVCSACSMSAVCWQEKKEDTLNVFSHLTRPLKENGKLTEEDFPKYFTGSCVKLENMIEEINRNYARHLIKETAEIRSSQIREVVEEHFRTTAGILGELAGEFSVCEQFDAESAARVSAILRENGIEVREICCRTDKFGRMTIEALTSKSKSRKINKAELIREISTACGRTFSSPCCTGDSENFVMRISERPKFEVKRGFSQISAGGSFCGDSAGVFPDGAGRLIAVLSDGMGTGGKAAVDGAMVSAMAQSLLKSGLGCENAMKTINSAMLAKGGDESVATLDCLCLDLFSGEAELFKAGAVGTVIRTEKECEFVENVSRPLGIMSDVKFSCEQRKLKSGDIIVMVSDGVTASGSEWLVDLCDTLSDEEPNKIAEQITSMAKNRRSDGHGDDITALVMKLE